MRGREDEIINWQLFIVHCSLVTSHWSLVTENHPLIPSPPPPLIFKQVDGVLKRVELIGQLIEEMSPQRLAKAEDTY